MCQFRNRKPGERAKEPLGFVHCDLTGPINPMAKDGSKYALSFVDNYTGINVIYFLKQKSDTVEAAQNFLADTLPFGKVIRSDNGTEILGSQHFKSLLRKNAMKQPAPNIFNLYCARMQSNTKQCAVFPTPKWDCREGVAKPI